MGVKKKKGAALVMVILVMAVMAILGTSILNVSLAQAKEASQEEKKMQAYYLARSGAEAALSAWENPNPSSSGKPAGIAQTVYLNGSNQFVDIQPEGIVRKFDVSVALENGNTVIKSIGTVGNVAQTVTATITPTATQVTIPVTVPSEVLLGHNQGWYDFNSGQIITGYHSLADKTKTIKFEAKKGKGIKIPNKNSPSVTYDAYKMVFTSEVQVLHNRITLISKAISFSGGIIFSNDGKGDINLKVPAGQGISRPEGGIWGVVYIKGKGYYFPDNVVLKNQNDIETKLTEIPDTDNTDYMDNSYTDSKTETVITNSVIWN